MGKVVFHKVYDKTSHTKDSKHGYPPVRSVGTYQRNGILDVTVHMTPELRNHPTERRILLAHEKREAKLLAKEKPNGGHYSVDYAHRQAASKDPDWLKGERGYFNIWNRLGKKAP
jgi:hypothetical protein